VDKHPELAHVARNGFKDVESLLETRHLVIQCKAMEGVRARAQVCAYTRPHTRARTHTQHSHKAMEGVRARAQVRAFTHINTHVQHTNATHTCNTHMQHTHATHTCNTRMRLCNTHIQHTRGYGERTRARAGARLHTRHAHSPATLTQGYGGRVCVRGGRAYTHVLIHPTHATHVAEHMQHTFLKTATLSSSARRCRA